MTSNNNEITKAKAESQRGRWFTDKLDKICPYEYYYCYAVEFVEKMNDWELQLYKFDTMFNTIETDTIYLEDLPEYMNRIPKKDGMLAYTTVKVYIETLLKAKPEDLENMI